MTLPERYGGHGRSPLERFAVIEELLAAGAPVGAHWIADRQTGPSILANGTEEQRARFLPHIARGECFFAIGMSEPDSGSDLASVRTRATGRRAAGGCTAPRCGRAARTSRTRCSSSHGAPQVGRPARGAEPVHRPAAGRAGGDPADPGLSGEHHFNEVVFDGAFVPDAMVLGRIGDGWRQVTAELAYERSGPERLLSTFLLIRLLHGRADGPAARRALGG